MKAQIDINAVLIEMADAGWWPQLVYDDDGHWAMGFMGTAAAQRKPTMLSVFPIQKRAWKSTPEAAVRYGYRIFKKEVK